jgi:hypothetical protein
MWPWPLSPSRDLTLPILTNHRNYPRTNSPKYSIFTLTYVLHLSNQLFVIPTVSKGSQNFVEVMIHVFYNKSYLPLTWNDQSPRTKFWFIILQKLPMITTYHISTRYIYTPVIQASGFHKRSHLINKLRITPII